MGDVVALAGRHDARASEEGLRAPSEAKRSSVISLRPRLPASLATASQCGAGMPRVRHPLTVEFDKSNASATSLVPPSASMIDPGVRIPAILVRTLRTSQEFASRETTFFDDRGPIGTMVDTKEVIGPRLKRLRLALDIKKQIDFAAEIGVEKNTYNPWETGKRMLTFEGACLIRKRYGIPLDYLFYGDHAGLPAWLHERLLKRTAA